MSQASDDRLLFFLVGIFTTSMGLWACTQIMIQFKQSDERLFGFLLSYATDLVGFETLLAAVLGIVGGVVIILAGFRVFS